MSDYSWADLYPGRTPEEGPPSEEECEAAARAVPGRGYQQIETRRGAVSVRPDTEPMP